MLTPLNVTSSTSGLGDDGNIFGFDRLAPLPAPRFGPRTPQTRADTEQYLKSQADSMGKLRLGERGQSAEESGYASGAESGTDARGGNRLFGSKVPPSTVKGKIKRSPGLPLLLKDEVEVVEAVSPGGHITKRRARSRPVSSELLKSAASTPALNNKVRVVLAPKYCSQAYCPS